IETLGRAARLYSTGTKPPPMSIRSTRSLAPVGCEISFPSEPGPPSSFRRPQAAVSSATAAKAAAVLFGFGTIPPLSGSVGQPWDAATGPAGSGRVRRHLAPSSRARLTPDGDDARPPQDLRRPRGRARRARDAAPGRGRGPGPGPRGLDLRDRPAHLRLERVGAGPDPPRADNVRPRGRGHGRGGRTRGPPCRTRRLRRGRDPYRLRRVLDVPDRTGAHLPEPADPGGGYRRRLRGPRGRSRCERVDRRGGDRARPCLRDGALRQRGACGVRDPKRPR